MEETPAEWLADFEAAARRTLEERLRYAFIHTYKPVLDDAPYRSFDKVLSSDFAASMFPSRPGSWPRGRENYSSAL